MIKKLKDRFDFLWTPSYPGMLTLMWLCILLALGEIALITVSIINEIR